MATNAQRQAKFRQQMTEKGLAQVAGWAPQHQAAELNILIRFLRDNPDLELVATVRDPRTGHFVKVR